MSHVHTIKGKNSKLVVSKKNLQLQGNDFHLIKAKTINSAFVSKLSLYKQNINKRQFHQFPNLSSVKPEDDDLLINHTHLEALREYFITRFDDLLNLIIPDWIINPTINSEIQKLSLQEEFIELSTNEELKIKLKNGYQEFWLQRQIPILYPALWAEVKKFIIAFPSTYLAEKGFSMVTNLLTKKRNRLSIVDRGDLRLLLTKIEPNIDKLVSTHQTHPSH